MSELPPLTAATLAEQGSFHMLDSYNVDTVRLPITISGNASMLPEVQKAITALDPDSQTLNELLARFQEPMVQSTPDDSKEISSGLKGMVAAAKTPENQTRRT